MCKMLLNEVLSGVELYFEGKPSKETLTELKENGYRWNGKKVCWYAKQSNETLEVANKLSGLVLEVAPVENKEVKKNNTIDLFQLTTFTAVQREKNYNTKEIAKEIRTHLKARFSFVKFSVTSKDRISVEIKSSPFEADSIYLKSIIEYVDKYVESFNFCTSYDPYGDYGSSYNFYYFGCKLYNYEQTEATAEIIEAMKNFDVKIEEQKELKRIEEERQYQEYLKEREIENKKAEERRQREKEEKEYIYNNVEVVEVEENNQYYVKNAYFANLNKNNTLEQYKEEVEKNDYYLNTLKVTREIHFKDDNSLNYFSNMLLHDFNFIDNTGGSYTEDLRINSMTDYYNMSKEEKETVEWLLKGIAVYNKDNELMFVIDAQGYCYSRYIGLIGDMTTTTKEYDYKQVVTQEEAEELKKEAKEIEEVFNNVIEKNSLDDWYNTRRVFVNELRKNALLNFSKESVQQVQEEKIKDYMYKTLKEVDRVEDQFNDNKLRIGEKLTLIKESMIGGASASHIIFNGYEEIEGYNGKKSIKVTLGVEGKKGLYSTTIGNDKVLIYKGWIDIPASVLYEDTSNEYFRGTQTKFGSYDTKALDEIINHLECEGNYPIINTYKPLF